MNRIILMGRLVKDPELRKTPNDKSVCTFTVAVDRPFSGKGGKTEADFINIVTWEKTADICAGYFFKGQKILLEGRLQIRAYEGNDGQKRWLTEVIADHVEFVESKKKDAQDGNAEARGPMDYFGEGAGNGQKTKRAGAEPTYFNEEIPF